MEKPIYKIVNSWMNYQTDDNKAPMEVGRCYTITERGDCITSHTEELFWTAFNFLCKHQDLWNEENKANG